MLPDVLDSVRIKQVSFFLSNLENSSEWKAQWDTISQIGKIPIDSVKLFELTLISVYPLFTNAKGGKFGASEGGGGGGSSGVSDSGNSGETNNPPPTPPVIPDSTEVQRIFNRLYGPESKLTETQKKLVLSQFRWNK